VFVLLLRGPTWRRVTAQRIRIDSRNEDDAAGAPQDGTPPALLRGLAGRRLQAASIEMASTVEVFRHLRSPIGRTTETSRRERGRANVDSATANDR
jgi:gamma-glutamyl phosphate reductase